MIETAKSLANSPDFARGMLRETRRAELPRLLRSAAPPEVLEPSQPEVDQLMESAAKMLKTLADQQTAMAAQLPEPSNSPSLECLTPQLQALKQGSPDAGDDAKDSPA